MPATRINRTPTGSGMSTEPGSVLYRLLTWLSPAYPVGAFAYSQGIETAVAREAVSDRSSAQDWIEDSLEAGALWSDAVIFARSHDAARARDSRALGTVNDFARAFQPTAELRAETMAQGGAFLCVTVEAWPCPALDLLSRIEDDQIAYPVAVACAAAGHGIALDAALEAWLHAGACNLVSACVRLVPLGQTDGQRILAGLEAAIAGTAQRARRLPLDDMFTSCLMVEVCSMAHETQATRLFRS